VVGAVDPISLSSVHGEPSGQSEQDERREAGRIARVHGEPGQHQQREQDRHREPGRIAAWSWATTGVFAAVALAVTLGATSLEGVAIVISLTLFAASLGVWAYAFGLAVVRSSRGDDISVASLFFLSSGAAPAGVRRHLLGSLAVGIVVAIATVKANPFGALVPMLPLGLAGLWAARHGTFPPRSRVPSSLSRRSDGRPGQ
jgi:hypothetical protein